MMLSVPNTCAAKLKFAVKTRTGRSKNNAKRGIMTCTTRTMINPSSTIFQQGLKTQEESSHFHVIFRRWFGLPILSHR
jgi:hypothetical protein